MKLIELESSLTPFICTHFRFVYVMSSAALNPPWKSLNCHAGCQELSRCGNRGVCGTHCTHVRKHAREESTLAFETQDRPEVKK